jgi:hypothetical protein
MSNTKTVIVPAAAPPDGYVVVWSSASNTFIAIDPVLVVEQAGGIIDAQIAINAAIQGTKINPNFGAQDIQTTGTVKGMALAVNNGSTAPTITSGTGVPVAPQPNGSLYMRVDGTSVTGLYIFETGIWAPLAPGGGGGSPVGPAVGDLGGNYPNPVVTGVRGHTVPAPSGTNTVLTWSGTSFSWAVGGGGGGGASVPIPVELSWMSGATTNTTGITPLMVGRRNLNLSLFPPTITVSSIVYNRTIRFYADISGASGNASVQLNDKTASEIVAGSYLTTSSTTSTELNSGPLTVGMAANNLKDGYNYEVDIFNSAANNTIITNARLVITYEPTRVPVLPDVNTLLYYPLDEAGSVINWYNTFDPINTNTSVLSLATGVTVTTPPGVYGTCLDFARIGNGGVNTVNTASGTTAGTTLTISCWVYVRSYNVNSVFIDRAYRNNGTWTAPFVGAGMELSSANDGSWNSTITISGVANTITSPAGSIPLNTWTFIATTYDGTTITQYKNGVSIGTMTVPGTIDWGATAGSPLNYTFATSTDTFFNPLTTIGALSNGLTLPQPNIYIASTTGFDTAGVISVTTSGGPQIVTYTGLSGGNQLTGCTGGGGTMSTGGRVGMIDSGNHCDDCAGPTVNFPNSFSTMLYDQTFSSWVPESDGNIQFLSSSGSFSAAPLPQSIFNYAICFYWIDQDNTTPPLGFFYSIGGTAPNRVAHLTSINQAFGGGNPAIDVEVRMRELSPDFDIIYGPSGVGVPSGIIGVQRDTGSLFTNYPSAGATALPANGFKITFTHHNTGGTATGPWLIGGNLNSPAASDPYQKLDGRVDDVRVENVVRNGAYLLAEYLTGQGA